MSVSLEEKHVLVSALGLRYHELNLHTHDQRTQSVDLTNQLLKEIEPKESMVDDGFSKGNILNIADMIRDLNHTIEPRDHHVMKQAIMTAIKNDNELRDAALLSISNELSPAEVDNYRVGCTNQIARFFEHREFYKKVKKMLSNYGYRDNQGSNIQEIAQDIIANIMPYANAGSANGGTGIENPKAVASFSTEKHDTIAKVWQKAQDKSSTESILKTGYQGINRMLGAPGGFFRGDTVLIGALQHNYKSGSLNDWLSDICHFNKPYCYKEGKKGCVLQLSFENDAGDDLNRIYKRAYFLLYGKYPSLEEILESDPASVARVIDEYVGVNGFKYHYIRMNPSNVSYMDIQKIVLEFESQGYEIHVLGLDYLSMINLKGITRMGDGTEYQELFRLMRNFCSERDITMITPHQLSTEATYLNRDGFDADFVTKVAGKSYWSKSKQIDREVDVEIVQHIVHVPGPDGNMISYLTCAIGKNRRVHDTPIKHKSCALVFTDKGILPDMWMPDATEKTKPNFIDDLKKLRGMGGVGEDSELFG